MLGSISNDERKAIYDAWFDDMNLDIPTIKDIAEHFQGELWLLLSVVLLLIAFAWQSRRQRRQADAERAGKGDVFGGGQP